MNVFFRFLYLTSILLLTIGCKPNKPPTPSTFKMPKLNNSQVLDSLSINRPGTILAGEFPIYGGTYHFSDTIIDINPDSVINRYKRKDGKGTI